jgi:hypothetical protein
LVLGLAALAASAQSPGVLRWQATGNAIGLQAGRSDFRLNIQVASPEPTVLDRVLARSQNQGLSVKFVGKSALAPDFGLYGRVGRSPATAATWNPDTATMGAAGSYGVGLTWDISPRASAVLGWDSYDFRTVTGERDVRATSLGLHWRY